MNVHKNARMTRFGRLQLVHRIRQEGWTVAQAAEASSVSVRTAYKWLARYRAGGEPALCDRSSAPGHCPHRLAGETVAEIERLRRTRWTGPRISRATGVPLSTVGLVLRRLGLGRLRALDPRPPVIRYERKHPGEIIHIDTKKLGRINGPGHRMTGHRRGRKRGSGWEYLHVAIDDASRLAYTEVLASETGEACAGFMTRAARWFAACGVRIQRVMSDNAFAYTNSRLFKDALKAIGARHITTRPYTPRTNGKAERFIQTALREWLYAKSYNSSANRTADMPHWIHWYNLHRPHGGINASTPATRMNNLLGVRANPHSAFLHVPFSRVARNRQPLCAAYAHHFLLGGERRRRPGRDRRRHAARGAFVLALGDCDADSLALRRAGSMASTRGRYPALADPAGVVDFGRGDLQHASLSVADDDHGDQCHSFRDFFRR